MRLGCCGSIAQAAEIKAAGFDFLEVNVQSVLCGDEPSSTWDAKLPELKKVPLPIEAANCLLPGAHKVVGPERNMRSLQDYMQRVAKRAQVVGISHLVFGSGAARKRPDGVDEATANAQLAEFTRMAGEVCAHHDVTLVIEHLHFPETNTLNRLTDCRTLCDQVNHRSVALLVDSFHYGMEKETDQALLNLGDRVKHVHVAELIDRVEPGKHAGTPKAFDFHHFFCLLKKIGYDGRISIECKWSASMAEVGAGSAVTIRQTWDRASADDCG